MSTPTLQTPSDDELPALLADLDASGQSVTSFARARGLTPWKLYVARRDRRADRFQPIRIVDAAPQSPAAPIELALETGHRVLLPPTFDAASLRRLLEVLASC